MKNMNNLNQKRNIKVRHQLRRIDKLIKIGAPDIIALNDVLLLGERISGGAFKFVLFVLKSWWQTNRINPMYHYRIWQMNKTMKGIKENENA